MKRFVPALGLVLAIVPGVASAALSIGIGPDIAWQCGTPGEQFVDLIFNDSGPATNEGLFAYDLYIVRDNPAITLLRAEKPDNWVFTSPGAVFQQAGPEFSNAGWLVVNAIGDILGPNQDIVGGTKAARVFFTVDSNAGPGYFRIGLDNTPGTTLFVSGDTGEAIPVDISDPGTVISWCPEPAGLSLAGIAATLILRRRRRGHRIDPT